MGARGEGIILLPDGSEVTVLFTNRALVEVEQALGKSTLALAQGFGNGDMGVGDITQMLLVGMRAARRDTRSGGPVPSMLDAYNVMDQVGFTKVSEVVVLAIAAVLSYGTEEADADESPNA